MTCRAIILTALRFAHVAIVAWFSTWRRSPRGARRRREPSAARPLLGARRQLSDSWARPRGHAERAGFCASGIGPSRVERTGFFRASLSPTCVSRRSPPRFSVGRSGFAAAPSCTSLTLVHRHACRAVRSQGLRPARASSPCLWSVSGPDLGFTALPRARACCPALRWCPPARSATRPCVSLGSLVLALTGLPALTGLRPHGPRPPPSRALPALTGPVQCL